MKSNISNKKNSYIGNKNKQSSGKSAIKKNKVNINIHPEIYNASSESRPYNDSKIHLTNHRKMYKSVKDINPNKKTSSITNRNTQPNKINKRKIKIITTRNNDDSKNKSVKKSAYSKSVKAISLRNDTSSKKNDDNDDENSDDDDDYKKEDDFLYRTLYKSSKDRKDLSNDKYKKLNNSVETRHNYSEVKINKINKTNGNNTQKPKEKKSIQNSGNSFSISMEKTDNIRYNKDDGKFYSSNPNEKTPYKKIKNDVVKISKNKSPTKPKNKFNKLNMERTIDLYVLDGNEDISLSQKNKEAIDIKRNKVREVMVQKFGPGENIDEEKKYTGFIFIRKSKGKKLYAIELGDDMEKINSVLKDKNIMINNKIIQLISLDELSRYQNEIKNLNENLNKEEQNLEKEKNKDKDKESEISELKSKIDELNSIINNQKQDLEKSEQDNAQKLEKIQNEYDQLKLSYQSLEKENLSLMNQVPSISIKKNISAQIEYNQKNIKEMQGRIQKYKNELKKSINGHRQSFISSKQVKNYPINRNSQKIKSKKHKNSVDIPKSKYEEIEKKIKVIDNPQNDQNDDDDSDYGLDFKDDGNNPKSKKMRKALDRFNQKYSNVIKEEKKLKKLKEKEEAEKQIKESEENLEGEKENNNNNENKNNEENLKEIKENEEKEEKEKEERERLDKEEAERLEKEEAERLEKERLEREEAERLEKERIEREERERQEKEEAERLEKERLEREEAERIERERLEKEEAERLEKERLEREEAERLEKERIEREEKERLEKEEEERIERERIEKEEKERLEREEAEKLENEAKEEKERLEKEEAEQKEREEKERIEREEKERLEKEEEEKKEREEKERKEKEEKEKKEKEEKEKKEKEKKEKEKKEKEKKDKEKKDKEKKEKEKKDKPGKINNKFGGGVQSKFGGNFAKMLADKLKMPPGGGMRKVGIDPSKRDSQSKPPAIQSNVDVTKLIEQKPFKGRSEKRKPTKKVFVEQIEEDNWNY